MTYIDFADNEKQIDKQVTYWAGKIKALGAESVAGVTKVKYSKGKWAVDLIIYVDKDSQAFHDFMKRFR